MKEKFMYWSEWTAYVLDYGSKVITVISSAYRNIPSWDPPSLSDVRSKPRGSNTTGGKEVPFQEVTTPDHSPG